MSAPKFIPHTTASDYVYVVDRQRECVLLMARNAGNAAERCRVVCDALNARGAVLMAIADIDDRIARAKAIAQGAIREWNARGLA